MAESEGTAIQHRPNCAREWVDGPAHCTCDYAERYYSAQVARLTSERDEARAKAIEAMRPLIETVALEAMKPYGEELTRGQIQMLSDVIAREAVSRALLNGGVK